MDFKNSTQPNLITVIIILFIGLLIESFAMGIYFNRKLAYIETQFLRQTAEIQKNNGSFAASKTPPVRTVDGIVGKIEGNTITVDSLFNEKIKKYSVKVGNSTKIFKREMPKDSAIKETNAKLSDLKINDHLSIGTSENLTDKNEFEAKSIYILIMDSPDI